MARTFERPPWRIEITVRPGVVRLVAGATLADLMSHALTAAGAPSPARVGVILADDLELAGLNEQAMGRPGPTDVLSFPLLPPASFPKHTGGRSDGPGDESASAFILPPTEPVHLGEVVISVQRAIAQAAAGRGGQTGDVRWSAADELRLLVAHGTLHLCGWDHDDPAEAAAMRALERKLLGLSSRTEER